MKKSNKEVISYLVFGVLTTAINIGCYWFLTKIVLFDYKTATTIAWVVSVLFAFITNKLYVFNSKSFVIKIFLKELFAFFLFRSLSYVVDLGMMIVIIEWIHIDDMIAKVAANIVVILINFFASKFYIFKPEK
ncbi:MAG: GtrA family protein [Bacillus sp. (in: Bacteria)]|nr:GtrA family protein [Bacillus sp. (in: firmicutes)]